MTISPALFSSAKGEWATPQDLFDQLDQEFHFTLDAAADQTNAKCFRWYGPGSALATDALTAEWDGVVWCNPPYGRGIGVWVKKAFEAAVGGATVVMLLPARTDTAWFHDYAVLGELRFLRGRLKFGGADAGAPFPSLIAIFRFPPPGRYDWAIPHR